MCDFLEGRGFFFFLLTLLKLSSFFYFFIKKKNSFEPSMGQTQTKQAGHENPKKSPSSLKHSFKARKHLSRIELVSLQYIFNDLKSTFPDGFTCIEPKNFLVKNFSICFFFSLFIKKYRILGSFEYTSTSRACSSTVI